MTGGTLPAGLSLDAESGEITGIPTAAGIYPFTVKATNAFGSTTQELSITVVGVPAITTTSLPSGFVGVLYSAQIETLNDEPITFTITAGNLPAELNLNADTGVISGTPIEAGTSTFTIKAENAIGFDTQELSIEISAEMQGSGTSGDPYQIWKAEQLAWFAGQVNGGRQNIHAVLMADIALNETEGWENWADITPDNTWTPIGTNYNYRFIGSFNGNNHTISGVYVSSSGDYQGLFGYVYSSTIQNLNLTESYIRGKSNVGGICGWSFGSNLVNCRNAGTITGSENYVGGICGTNLSNNTIQNCYNAGTVTGPGVTGGIAGANNGIVKGCCNEGTINSNGTSTQFGGVCSGNTGVSVVPTTPGSLYPQ